jgi:hypothetical protein
MGNAEIPIGRQIHHPAFPGIRIQRPAMAENDGLTFAPVFIVQFDAMRVFFPDSYAVHNGSPFSFLID